MTMPSFSPAKTHVAGDSRVEARSPEATNIVSLLATPGKVRSRPITLLIVCATLLIAAIAFGTATMIFNLRDRVLTNNERELQNIALVVAAQTDRIFEAAERVQTNLIERVEALGIASSEDFERKMSGYDVHQILKDRIVGLPHVGTFTLVNAEGKIFNFSRSWPIPAINIADRDFFKALQSNAPLSTFLSKAITNRATGSWVVQIARKVSGPKGEFLGLVMAAIELQSIEQFFATIALGPDSAISLFHRDGELLARHPHVDAFIGRPIPNGMVEEMASDADRHMARRATVIGGGENRVIAGHRVAHYPLVVTASATVASILAGWQKEAMFLAGAGGLMAFMIAAMAFLIVRQMSRGERQVQSELDARKLYLDIAIGNIVQGVVMFDSSKRLTLCNRRFIEIYGLSPEVVRPGCTFKDVMWHRKETGSFLGDVEQFCAELDAHTAQGMGATLIQSTTGGRWIRAVNQPLAGGGWVVTHEDITERHRLLQAQKQAEEQLREQKLQLDTALNNMTQGLNMFDTAGRLVVRNDRYLQMYRLSPDIIKPGCTVRDLVEQRIAAGTFFSGDQEKYIADLTASMAKKNPTSATMDLTDGRVIAVISQPTADGGGWVVTHEDITERRRAEKERDRSQALANTVIENVPVTIVLKDAHDLRFVLINRTGEEFYGVRRENMIGKTVHDLFPSTAADDITEHDKELVRSGERQYFDEHPVAIPGNKASIVTTTRLPIRDQDGELQYLLTVIEDRTQRKRDEARIAHMAFHDPLTDLPNRAAFNECLEATREQAASAGESFAVLCLDLDRFKEINDVFGHSVGDVFLRQIARRLEGACEGAFLARPGGDEFTVITALGPQPATAEAISERINVALAKDIENDGHLLRAGLTTGVSIYPNDGTDAESLVANADAALYRAKADERGSVRFFEPDMDKRLREKRTLQHDLRSAIARNELELYYQPQALIGGEITGFEALVRWHHPSRGVISPGTFIPLAEESGLIMSLGEWILREACREAASWPRLLSIAINLSPMQFRHGDLPGLVHEILLETGLTPGRLELEITEGVLVDDFSRALSLLRRLKNLGVRIAMDDFGTGYSSLSYLQSFPFDKIKIDQAFISKLGENSQSAAIIRAVIGLGRGLDLPVVAEGVETEEQLTFLTKEGCNELQGFLIGRPKPIRDYGDLVGRAATIEEPAALAAYPG